MLTAVVATRRHKQRRPNLPRLTSARANPPPLTRPLLSAPRLLSRPRLRGQAASASATPPLPPRRRRAHKATDMGKTMQEDDSDDEAGGYAVLKAGPRRADAAADRAAAEVSDVGVVAANSCASSYFNLSVAC